MSKSEFLSNAAYEKELERLQIELVKLQEWVKLKGLKVVVIFEGRDAAGKGGVIKRITERLNPRVCRVVALGIPSDREKTQWYFQRYVQHLPASGEIVLMDRSWYNRAGVEKVMGFCTKEEHEEFLRSCPEFEKMLIRSGTILIKYWFSVSDDEQERRFQDRMDDPTKRWKISPMDLESRKYWVEYSKAKDEMMDYTDGKITPWYVVPSDNKMHARINCISHLLSVVPYEDIQREKLELPKKQDNDFYMRPPMDEQTFVPDVAAVLAQKNNSKDSGKDSNQKESIVKAIVHNNDKVEIKVDNKEEIKDISKDKDKDKDKDKEKDKDKDKDKGKAKDKDKGKAKDKKKSKNKTKSKQKKTLNEEIEELVLSLEELSEELSDELSEELSEELNKDDVLVNAKTQSSDAVVNDGDSDTKQETLDTAVDE